MAGSEDRSLFMFEAARAGGALGTEWAGGEVRRGWARGRRQKGVLLMRWLFYPSPGPSRALQLQLISRAAGLGVPQALSHLNMTPHPLPLTGWFPWGSEPGLPLQAPPQSQMHRVGRRPPCPPQNTPSDFLWVGGTHGQWLKTPRGSHFTDLTVPPLLLLSPGL